MIVGFLASTINVLSQMKHYASQYPHVGFIAYIDSQNHLEHAEDIASGYAWLSKNGANLVIVEHDDVRSQTPGEVRVLLQTEITAQDFEGERSVDSSLRLIHLTHHSKTQDEDIALILNGTFISS